MAWIASACGQCEYCLAGNENLCNEFKATGRDVNGGYAEYMTVRADFVHPIPETFSDAEAAPLLCAGAIGYRSLRLANINRWAIAGVNGLWRVESSGLEDGETQISRIKYLCL